jgi:hypothetical protein
MLNSGASENKTLTDRKYDVHFFKFFQFSGKALRTKGLCWFRKGEFFPYFCAFLVSPF